VTEADAAGIHRLIAGGHRVAAAALLGWSEIDAIPFGGSELEAELLQLEENLARHELNPLDRATFLARWQEVYQALHPGARRGGDRRGKSFRDQTAKLAVRSGGFSAAVRERLGLSDRSVERAVALAKALTPEQRDMLAGTDIARNGAELALLVRLPHADRAAVLEQAAARGGAGRVAELLRAAKGIAVERDADPERWFKRLMEAWRKASKRERTAFLAAIRQQERGA
jgi:ParB family chromosome partitioning protein